MNSTTSRDLTNSTDEDNQYNGVSEFNYSRTGLALRVTGVSFVSLAILLSNVINFIVLNATKQIPATAKVWLNNLSAADFILGLVACLPCVVPAITAQWPYGIVWCQIAGIVHSTCATVSIWSVAVLSVDRYVAVSFPVKYKTKLTVKRSVKVCVSLWIVSFVVFLLPNIFSGNFIYYQYYPQNFMCGLYWKSLWLTIITGALVPYLSGLTILITSTKTSIALRKVRRIRQQRHACVTAKSSREEQAVKVVIVTAIVYFMAWGPYMFVSFCVILIPGGKDLVPAWVETLTMWIANSNSFVNVVIYSTIYRAYRDKLKQIASGVLRRKCCYHGGRIEPSISSLTRSSNNSKRTAEMVPKQHNNYSLRVESYHSSVL